MSIFKFLINPPPHQNAHQRHFDIILASTPSGSLKSVAFLSNLVTSVNIKALRTQFWKSEKKNNINWTYTKINEYHADSFKIAIKTILKREPLFLLYTWVRISGRIKHFQVLIYFFNFFIVFQYYGQPQSR